MIVNFFYIVYRWSHLVVTDLQQKISLYENIYQSQEEEIENLHVHKFVILCETFLKMYHVIFNQMVNYIFRGSETKKMAWQQKNLQVPFLIEDFSDFDVSMHI